jgi:hypothetical protein
MNKIIAIFLVLALFACKKEESNTVNNVPTFDSIVYYNKWTKVTKTNYFYISVNDIEVLANKKVALVGDADIVMIDSNFNFWRSSKFFSNTYNIYKLSQASKFDTIRNRFYYLSALTSTKVPYDQIFVSNELRDNEVNTHLYNRAYFINDTAKNNMYYVRSHDYDYFFYYVHKPLEKGYNYLFNYFDHNKSKYKSIEFNSEFEIIEVFRLGNKIFFQPKYGDLYKVIDIFSFDIIDENYSTDYAFIGVYNGFAYLIKKDRSIYKTTDFVNYTKVFQDNFLNQIITYFNGKYLLYYKYDYLNATTFDEIVLFDLKTNKSLSIKWEDPAFDSIQNYWVIDNVLYLLTEDNIYARKF